MAEAAHGAEARGAENRRLLTRLSVVAVLMFGFGFALVPFYEKICLALGVNSLVERADQPANTQIDYSRTVTIELDANTHGLPWRFRPRTAQVAVHPGELVHVEYEIANVRSAAAMSPTAITCAGLMRALSASCVARRRTPKNPASTVFTTSTNRGRTLSSITTCRPCPPPRKTCTRA